MPVYISKDTRGDDIRMVGEAIANAVTAYKQRESTLVNKAMNLADKGVVLPKEQFTALGMPEWLYDQYYKEAQRKAELREIEIRKARAEADISESAATIQTATAARAAEIIGTNLDLSKAQIDDIKQKIVSSQHKDKFDMLSLAVSMDQFERTLQFQMDALSKNEEFQKLSLGVQKAIALAQAQATLAGIKLQAVGTLLNIGTEQLKTILGMAGAEGSTFDPEVHYLNLVKDFSEAANKLSNVLTVPNVPKTVRNNILGLIDNITLSIRKIKDDAATRGVVEATEKLHAAVESGDKSGAVQGKQAATVSKTPAIAPADNASIAGAGSTGGGVAAPASIATVASHPQPLLENTPNTGQFTLLRTWKGAGLQEDEFTALKDVLWGILKDTTAGYNPAAGGFSVRTESGVRSPATAPSVAPFDEDRLNKILTIFSAFMSDNKNNNGQ